MPFTITYHVPMTFLTCTFVRIFSDDHSRVLLQRSMQVRQRQSDYINANYIDVRKLAYMYRTYI